MKENITDYGATALASAKELLLHILADKSKEEKNSILRFLLALTA